MLKTQSMAHKSKPDVTRDFEIPARFIFQPFSADWRIVSAETVEWVENPTLLRSLLGRQDEEATEKNWLRVRIDVPDAEDAGMISMFARYPSYTVLMNRTEIPEDVLTAHENHQNTPDVAGRSFLVLIYEKPEFMDRFWTPAPGDTSKDARPMRDEFLNLSLGDDANWPWSLRRFLNKWGLWELGSGFWRDRNMKNDQPGFVVVSPHSLREQQDNYRKAVLKSSGREWLSTHTLSGVAQDVPPYFFVRCSYCKDAIEAAITIDHLENRDFGICKRHDCRRQFERTSGQRKVYCSIECAHLANVRKLRAAKKQAERKKKGAKLNAKS